RHADGLASQCEDPQQHPQPPGHRNPPSKVSRTQPRVEADATLSTLPRVDATADARRPGPGSGLIVRCPQYTSNQLSAISRQLSARRVVSPSQSAHRLWASGACSSGAECLQASYSPMAEG